MVEIIDGRSELGIYPERHIENRVSLPDGGETWVEVEKLPGLTRTRTVTAETWVEVRDDCFCCSCDNGYVDVLCRNHGYYGSRPCEEHGMPGQETDDGEMPKSVQQAKRERAERDKRWREREGS